MKNITKKYEVDFIQELSELTEIPKKVLETYVEAHPDNIINIIEHPERLNVNPRQMEKMNMLNSFLSSYSLVKFYEIDNKINLNSTDAAGKYFTSLMANRKDKEVFIASYLNSQGDILETDIITEGGINYTTVDLRAMLKRALNLDTAQLIVAHCHPSGSLKPSREDINVTNRIRDVFEPLSIKLADHIIVGGWDYISFYEKGYLSDKYRQADIPYYGNKLKISEQNNEYSLLPKLNSEYLAELNQNLQNQEEIDEEMNLEH